VTNKKHATVALYNPKEHAVEQATFGFVAFAAS
jgi:hypothetical protein